MSAFIKNQIKRKKKFVIYTWVGVLITTINIFLLWLFIDIFKIPTIISSITIVGGLFLFKFYLYKKTGFTN